MFSVVQFPGSNDDRDMRFAPRATPDAGLGPAGAEIALADTICAGPLLFGESAGRVVAEAAEPGALAAERRFRAADR